MNKCKRNGLWNVTFAVMLIVGIALPMAGAQTESTTPISSEVNITGPNVVFFNVSGMDPIENKQRVILQGNKTSTGCQYTIKLYKTSAEAKANIVKVAREIGVNPDTCQQLVDIGTLNKSPESINISKGNTKFFQSTNAVQSGIYGPTQTTMYTRWIDPVGITVNYVKDTINWNWDWNYVYPNWANDYHWWYLTTHWYDVTWNYLFRAYTEGYPVQDIVAETYDHMENDWFMGTTTNVYYQPNFVEAYPGGASVGTVHTWDDGLIYWMLHYETILS